MTCWLPETDDQRGPMTNAQNCYNISAIVQQCVPKDWVKNDYLILPEDKCGKQFSLPHVRPCHSMGVHYAKMKYGEEGIGRSGLRRSGLVSAIEPTNDITLP